MDAYLTVVSLRRVVEYSDREISEATLERILQAGRSTGSSQNRQLWRFFVMRDPGLRAQLAETVYAPENITGCRVVVAVAVSGKSGFDTGRVAQNMMLAAWNEGIGSAPNGVRDADTAREILGLEEEENVGIILSFGYPVKPWTPRDAEGILRRIKRKGMEELVVRVDSR